jgi:hypothetical protein
MLFLGLGGDPLWALRHCRGEGVRGARRLRKRERKLGSEREAFLSLMFQRAADKMGYRRLLLGTVPVVLKMFPS